MSERTKHWAKILAENKFKLDLGISFLVIFSVILLIINASKTLSRWTGLSLPLLVGIGVPSLLFGTWFFGLCLDKFGFQHGINENQNERTPQIQELLEQTNKINSLVIK